MRGIDCLIEEHKNILRMNVVVEELCIRFMEEDEIDTDEFRKIIDFIRNYADRHHHGKEEKILFVQMLEELGNVADNLIRHGMLIEHDLGRLHVMNLEQALAAYDAEKSPKNKLDIISNACGYVNLLRRHIEKEDTVLFPYADRNLSKAGRDSVNEETDKFEQEAETDTRVKAYLSFLEELEAKVIS